MGQYHKVVNLDRCEYVNPHYLGAGLKLWEQLASTPGTSAALVVLLASASNGAGGGDLKEASIVGSWRGDRIAFVGDYDDDSRYRTPKGELSGAEIYRNCNSYPDSSIPADAKWRDVSHDVAAIIEMELDGKFTGEGWRDWTPTDPADAGIKAMRPDMMIIARSAP